MHSILAICVLNRQSSNILIGGKSDTIFNDILGGSLGINLIEIIIM